MSQLFFDKLVKLPKVEREIKFRSDSIEEKTEMWELVDNIVHHSVLDIVLFHLPLEHHDEFLTIYHKCPHDEVLIFEFLHKKSGKDIKDLIKKSIRSLEEDILKDVFSKI